MAPLSGSVSALKRLVETNLREKEQAAELLKGYVTTITREVGATFSFTYVYLVYVLWDLALCFGISQIELPSS